MTTSESLLALVPAAYVLGSIPFGLLIGLWRGIDPRNAGSGNIGATNVARLLGGKFFALVFTLDLLKGLIPMLVGAMILHGKATSRVEYSLWLLVGFAAVCGHMFSLFLKFKGGKGVATTAGIALGVFPYYTLPAVVAVATFAVVFFFTRIVSLGSIIAALVLPACYVIFGIALGWDITGTQLPLLIFALLVAVMVIYRHRSNIRRLIAGTENRFERAGGRGQRAE